MKHVIPHLRRAGGGSIINLSSIYGLVSAPDVPPYHASKGAVRMMTKTDALLYAKEKIRCNCVCPALVDTPMAADAIADPDMNAMMLAKHPIGRFGTPDDVARMLLYLASDDASWVTGSFFPIDGGWTAQ